MVKNKNSFSLLISALTAAFSFMVILGLWLLHSVNEGICIEFPAGKELTLEYGTDFSEDARAYLQIPLLKGALPLPISCREEVDTLRLGSTQLIYRASFFGYSQETARTIRVVDTQPPVITLHSREGYRPDWMEGYQEEGYEAVDACDGDLTAAVNISREGNVFTYTVSDASGNRASVSRTVDYQQNYPHIQLVGGEQLLLCPLPSFPEPGYQALDEQGRDYSSQVQVTGAVNSAVPGEYTLCYSLTNPNGESMSTTRQVRVAMDPCEKNESDPGAVIYLTFDDGPGPYTDALLDLLAAYDAKATFFVTGNNSRYQDCIGRAYAEGHSIGVHSYTHNYRQIYASEENYFADFIALQQLILQQTGQFARLVRFPGGSSNTVSCFNPGIMTRLSQGLEAMGYRFFDWNVNSGDAEGAGSTGAVADNIIAGCIGKHEPVVLQHDIKAFSVKAVEQVLIWGRNNGYRFLALDANSPGAHHGIAN